MKEDNKKTTTKKTNKKKTNSNAKKNSAKKTAVKPASKKVANKVTVAKKTTKKTPSKVTVAKKTVKKTPTKVAVNKTNVDKTPVQVSVEKEVIKKVETVEVNNKIEEKDTLNKSLVLRAVLLVSYTLIIVFLVIGFVDSLTKSAINSPKGTISSYVATGNVLDKSNIIDLEDASFKFSALNGDYFIYISYTSKEVNVLERDLVKLFSNKKLKNKLYYVNVDEIKDENNSISLINKYLSFRDALVNSVPAMVYVNKDNIIRSENIVSGNGDNLLTIGQVENLLDRNGF